MSYSIVKISGYYPEFLNSFYATNAGLRERPYQAQYEQLMQARFGWSNFYSMNFEKIGVQAREVVSNAQPMQKAWLKENASLEVGKSDLDEKATVLLQLKAWKPDVLFVEDCYRFGADFISQAREQVPSIRKIIAYHCAPLTNKVWGALQACDLVFSCHPGFLATLKEKGSNAFRLNHAFEPQVLDEIKVANSFPHEKFLFIGSVLLSDDYHVLRWKTLEALVQEGVDMKIYGNFMNEPIRRNPIKIFKRRKISVALSQKTNAPVFGLKMFQALSRAEIAFNNHIDAAGAYAANMRLFEATGVGTCLLTDWKENLSDYFLPDEEVVTYRTPEECVEKVKWLLQNPEKRKQTALAGQKKTLTSHTYSQRVRQLDEILRKHL